MYTKCVQETTSTWYISKYVCMHVSRERDTLQRQNENM